MKKRIIAAAIFILAVLVGIIIYTNANHKRISEADDCKTADIIEIGGFHIDDITKISFQYGNPAMKGVTVENKEKIKEFLKYINSCRFKKVTDNILTTGYYHHIVLFADDKQVMDIMTNDDFITINGTDYKMVESNVSLEGIDNFVKSAK